MRVQRCSSAARNLYLYAEATSTTTSCRVRGAFLSYHVLPAACNPLKRKQTSHDIPVNVQYTKLTPIPKYLRKQVNALIITGSKSSQRHLYIAFVPVGCQVPYDCGVRVDRDQTDPRLMDETLSDGDSVDCCP